MKLKSPADGPTVYITAKGGRYVKTDELFRSRRVVELMDKMSKLDISVDHSKNSQSTNADGNFPKQNKGITYLLH